MSTSSGVADGLTHTGYLRLVNDLGTKYAERLVSAEQVITDFRDRRAISEIIAYGQLCEMTRQIIEKALSNEIITPGVTSVEEVGWRLVEQVQALGADPMYTRIFTPQVIYPEYVNT